MLVRVTLVLMMALLCSKPEHELPHQPQFLPSPRNLSITGLLRWALFYFAAPYCPTSMARCLIFFLCNRRGGGGLTAMQGEKPLPTLHGEGSMHFVLCSPIFTIWTSNAMMILNVQKCNSQLLKWNFQPPLKICAGVLDKSLRCDSSLRWPSYFLLRSTTNFLQTASYVPLLRSQFRTWTNMVPLLSNLITVRFPDERFSVLEIPRPRWCWSM